MSELTLNEAIKHYLEVAEKNETQAEKWQEEGCEKWGKTIACREYAAEQRQLAEWLIELTEAKAMILDTSYTLEVMCDKVSTKIGCERCTYYDKEIHGCEVRKWIDKMRTFCKGRKGESIDT